MILSDLDGTLIDSTASVVRAFEWWAALHDLAPGVAERIPYGRTSTDAEAVLAPHLDPVVEGARLDERQRLDTAGVRALPGARIVLERYQPLAVVTSCPRPLARARLAAARLPEPATLITPELCTRGKPDPEPYFIGADRLGVAPHRCVVIEDAPSGVTAGLAAGTRVIAVLTTHSRDELAGASAYVNDLTEMPAVLSMLSTA